MQSQTGAAIAATAIKLGLAAGLEILLLVLHFAVYVQTIEVLPVDLHLSLSELPVVGVLFGWNPDFTLMHLLSAIFAVASVTVPILIWYTVLAEDILDDAGSYFASLLVKLKAALAIAVYGGLVTLEFKMLYARIQQHALDPFASVGAASAGESVGFAVFVSAMFVLVNAAMALFTAQIYVGFKTQLSDYRQQSQGGFTHVP